VHALRAIFACWQDGAPLDFRGEHYRLTRMQDYVKPPRIAHPDVPICLAGIGPAMTALAGELASGLTTHPTNSAPAFLRDVTLPALARGAARTGRTRADVKLHVNPFIATGADLACVARERESARSLLATLWSTPQYWRTLELLGFGEAGRALHSRVREGRWSELAPLVSDAMLDAAVPSAPYTELPAVLDAWYGSLGDGIALPVPVERTHDAALGALVAELRK
jgi:probable F420-dependent oxidoreductase